MRLTRQFHDAAYFTGELSVAQVLEQVERHVQSRGVELIGERAVFSRAYVTGDRTRRPLRIEISRTPRGSQIHIADLTPTSVTTSGLSEAERWRQAGRKPDGTPLDPNQLY
jgi:hypothetical protein